MKWWFAKEEMKTQLQILLTSSLNPYLLKCWTAFGTFLSSCFLFIQEVLRNLLLSQLTPGLSHFEFYLSFIKNGNSFLWNSLENKSFPWQNNYLHPPCHSFFILEAVVWVCNPALGWLTAFCVLTGPASHCIQHPSNHNEHSDTKIKPSWGSRLSIFSLKHIYQRKPEVYTCKLWSCNHCCVQTQNTYYSIF